MLPAAAHARAVTPSIDARTLATIQNRAVASFFSIFENVSEGAIMVDPWSRITWIDRKYLDFLGLPNDTPVVGRHIHELIPASRMPDVLRDGKAIPFDIMEHKNGWCVVSRFPLMDDDGALIGGFGFVMFPDLTPLRPAYEKLREIETDVITQRARGTRSRAAKYAFEQFVGDSAPAVRLKAEARRAAAVDSTVLIHGETGTGKELIAQAIHADSSRAKGNFVGLNVAAIPDELMEVELFGAKHGAYTGADRQGRIGKLALADHGTLFLDEVADMPPRLQVKLLRALQEREFEPLGSNTIIQVDIRLIAASSKDLAALVEAGQFRADLYYRLNVVRLDIPPLRERAEDIPSLARLLCADVCRALRIDERTLSDDAIASLSRRPWPGNVRELRNAIERACVLATDHTIAAADLGDDPTAPPRAQAVTLQDAVAGTERRLIEEARVRTGGNKLAMSRLLGMSRTSLYKKLRAYGMD